MAEIRLPQGGKQLKVPKRYVILAEAAKLYGVRRQSISDASKPGKPLEFAVAKQDGRRVWDMTHPAMLAYKGGPNWTALDDSLAPEAPSTEGTVETLPEDVRQFWKWTVERIIRTHGTFDKFYRLVQSMEKVESIQEKRQKNRRESGKLISRELVQKHVFSLIEKLFQRLLQDLPVTLALDIHGMCESGATIEEVQAAIKNAISIELGDAKKGIARGIRKSVA